MLRTTLSALILLTSSFSALAAEPIVGNWRAPGGGIVEVVPCSGGFCATVVSGRHKGKPAGTMRGSGGEYTGTVTDPRDERTYSGSAVVNGNTMELTGCALRIFCKTQTWVRV